MEPSDALLTDQVAIVTYAGVSGVALPSTPGSDLATIRAAIAQLRSGGSTNGAAGIRGAYAIARDNFIPGGVNRVILATDGDFNVGVSNPTELLDIIRDEFQRLRDNGVSETELSDAKTYLTGSFPLRLDSNDRVANMLVGIQLEDLGIDYLDKRNSYIEEVTQGDVARVARRLLDPESLQIVVVGKPEGVAATN